MNRSNLDDVQAEFSKVSNLISAMDFIVQEIDGSCGQRARREIDALIGVRDAMEAQMEKAHGAFDGLFKALSKEDAA